PFPTLVTAY
ncbi:bacterial regulatory helix-turn-helix, lysR family protein, partial [Vibrio parahaemolyticus V-223/04]